MTTAAPPSTAVIVNPPSADGVWATTSCAQDLSVQALVPHPVAELESFEELEFEHAPDESVSAKPAAIRKNFTVIGGPQLKA